MTISCFSSKQCIPLVKVYCYFYWLPVCFRMPLRYFFFLSEYSGYLPLVLTKQNRKLFLSAETMEELVIKSMSDDKVLSVNAVIVRNLKDVLSIWKVACGYADFCPFCLFRINCLKGLADDQDLHCFSRFPLVGGNIGDNYLIFGRIGA